MNINPNRRLDSSVVGTNVTLSGILTVNNVTVTGNIDATTTNKTVTVGSLVTKDYITLPTKITASPTTGKLGYVITGVFDPDSKLTARISPYSGYLSRLTLPVGVWLIQGNAGFLCTVAGNNINFNTQILSTKNTGADLVAGSAVAINSGSYSCLALNSSNSSYWSSVNTILTTTVTVETIYYLNFYMNFTGGATQYTVHTTTNNPFSFRAIRIA